MAKDSVSLRVKQFISFLPNLDLNDKTLGKLEEFVIQQKISDIFRLKKQLKLKIDLLRINGQDNPDLTHYNLGYNALLKYEEEMSQDEQVPSLYCQYRR